MDQRTPAALRREEVLDKIVDICLAAGPVQIQTDKYFTNTASIVAANRDVEVTYAVFMRRRVVAALESILKGMDRWDTLVDLVAQLAEVIRLQTDARKAAESRGVGSRGESRDK